MLQLTAMLVVLLLVSIQQGTSQTNSKAVHGAHVAPSRLTPKHLKKISDPVLGSTFSGCHYPSNVEKTFNLITASLFEEHQIPLGDVLDVGAHSGGWACMYACFDANRTVHAVDPSPKLTRNMRCAHANFQPHNAAISNRSGFMHFQAKGAGFVKQISNHAQEESGDVPIQTLDYLFLELWKTRPGFLHIDVEGFELEVLQGAQNVIRKYQPVFSIEIHVLEKRDFTVELIQFAEGFVYSIYMVNEVCGNRADCRNFLCFPSVMQHMDTVGNGNGNGTGKNNGVIHPVLDLAYRTRTLVKVTHQDIFTVFNNTAATSFSFYDPRTFTVGH